MAIFDNDKTTTVDIPDFVEDKDTESTSVDMSIFKMSDDELYEDTPKKQVKEKIVEEEKEDAPKKHSKKSSSTIVLCLVLIVALLIISAGAIIFGVKKNSDLKKVNDELTQVKATIADYQNTINSLTEENNSLKVKIEETSKAGTASDPNNKYPKGSTLYVTEDGNGQGVKQKASMDSDFTEDTLYWGDKITLQDNATVDSDGNYWGKIDKGYIRIEYNGEIWCSVDPQ